jgi:hypothetical protein
VLDVHAHAATGSPSPGRPTARPSSSSVESCIVVALFSLRETARACRVMGDRRVSERAG